MTARAANGAARAAVLLALLAAGCGGGDTEVPAVITTPTEATQAETDAGATSAATPGAGTEPAAPTASPTATEPAASSTETTYTVQSGDTLTSIAERYGTTVDAIVEANDIEDPNVIIVGQELTIPPSS